MQQHRRSVSSQGPQAGSFWVVGDAGCLSLQSIPRLSDYHPEFLPFEELLNDLPHFVNETKNTSLAIEIEKLPSICICFSTLDYEQIKNQSKNYEKLMILENASERERCFQVFAFIASVFVQDYIRGEKKIGIDVDSASDPIPLPKQIAVPLYKIGKGIGREPIIDYASTVLANWSISDPTLPISVENVHIHSTLTGHSAEKWFYGVHVCVEYFGGRGISAMIKAQEIISRHSILSSLDSPDESVVTRVDAAERRNALNNVLRYMKRYSLKKEGISFTNNNTPRKNSILTVTSMLEPVNAVRAVESELLELAESIANINAAVTRLQEGCPPNEFFDIVRPWLAGWPQQRGVKYLGTGADFTASSSPSSSNTMSSSSSLFTETANQMNDDKVLVYGGASGAQSSLLPSIDSFLGISYGSNVGSAPVSSHDLSGLGKFVAQLLKYRDHMPPAHRTLVSNFEAGHGVRGFITAIDDRIGLLLDSAASTGNAAGSDELQFANLKLKIAYNRCIDYILTFRMKHAGFASSYITKMAQKRGAVETKGTGGSTFSTHLMRHVNDTRRCKYDIVGADDVLEPSSTFTTF